MNNIKVLNDFKDVNICNQNGRHAHGDRFFIFVIPRGTAGPTWESTIVYLLLVRFGKII